MKYVETGSLTKKGYTASRLQSTPGRLRGNAITVTRLIYEGPSTEKNRGCKPNKEMNERKHNIMNRLDLESSQCSPEPTADKKPDRTMLLNILLFKLHFHAHIPCVHTHPGTRRPLVPDANAKFKQL